MNGQRPRKVVQWTTGNVGRQAVAAVLDHPELELVGVFARDPGKVGRDVAELCGLDHPTGVLATGDVDELFSRRPDCVIYTPLHFDVAEVCRILRAGINVVTTAEFLTGTSIGPEATASLRSAALEGGATLFGTGINPGFAQLFAGICAGISRNVRTITVTESVDVTMFASDPNFEAVGWGRPPGDAGHAEAVEAALKCARKARQGGTIVSLHGAFHGRTYGALSATPQESACPSGCAGSWATGSIRPGRSSSATWSKLGATPT